jgi:hypothetical protein
MEKNKYFKTDERNNYMSNFSNKSELGNDYNLLNNEDYLHNMYKTNMQSQKLDKSNFIASTKPEPENYEMFVPVRYTTYYNLELNPKTKKIG